VTWDDVIALALGGMKLAPAVFWRLSMREWILTQRGYFDFVEQGNKLQWEIARWQTRIIARPDYKPGGFDAMLRFPWDGPKEDPAMNEEELNDFVKRMGTKFENGKFVN
jgi:hypothetical protein